jgi:DNA-binding SARP family transcriptional activator
VTDLSIPLSESKIHLQVLGDFRVLRAGEVVPVCQGGQRVLAFLGLHRRAMPRSRVAGTLWPERTGAQASANLRAALSRLPRPGGHRLTRSSTTELGLADDVEVDMWLCHTRIGELRAAETAPPTVADDPLLLFDDDVLPLWDDDWVLVERERHRQARLHALERLSAAHLADGRFDEALLAGLAAVAGESLRESAHRRVIEVHLAEQNPAEALRQYETYRRLLRAELGLRPSETIRRLVRALLGRPDDPAVGASGG